jgi:hypothetical protein
MISGVGIRQSEDNRPRRHSLEVFGVQLTRAGDADKYVRVFEPILQPASNLAGIGVLCQPRFGVVQVRQTVFTNDAFAVTHHDVPRAPAKKYSCHGHSGCPCAADDNPEPF